MVGTGIASSLVHEVGHQAAALLDLVNSLRPVLKGLQRGSGASSVPWQMWDRWISEIVADFWSVARVGIASTIGLIGVVSLPQPFVFRLNVDDPHPIPWIRVKLSAAIGEALYPHPQWRRLSASGSLVLPAGRAGRADARAARAVAGEHAGLCGGAGQSSPEGAARPLADGSDGRRAAPAGAARRALPAMGRQSAEMYRASPVLVFAVIGQARADGGSVRKTKARCCPSCSPTGRCAPP